jgi:hypothetical protein
VHLSLFREEWLCEMTYEEYLNMINCLPAYRYRFEFSTQNESKVMGVFRKVTLNWWRGSSHDLVIIR